MAHRWDPGGRLRIRAVSIMPRRGPSVRSWITRGRITAAGGTARDPAGRLREDANGRNSGKWRG
jgi:hypothetical protein